MPYRHNPDNDNCIQQQINGAWQDIQCYDTFDDAHAYLVALQLNVEDASKHMTETPLDNDKRIYFGSAVKALDNGMIEGQLIAFTDANTKDLEGEYFTKTTDLYADDYPIAQLGVLYQHGLDDTLGIKKIGKVVKSQIDDAGVWLQAQLDLADDYQRMIYEMAKSGKLGWSSGALPQSVKVAKDGHIQSWAVIEASVTPNPAMPFATQIHTMKTLKSVSTATAPKEAAGSKEVNADNATIATHNEQLDTSKGLTMSENMKMENEDFVRQIVRMVLEESQAMYNDDKMEEEDLMEAVAMDMDDDEKAMDEEELAKSVAEKAWLIMEARSKKRRKALEAAKAVNASRRATAQPDEGAYMPSFKSNRNQRVSVGENLKYAHLTAEDMAAGYLLIESAYPQASRGRIPANQIVSDEYVKHMVAKALQTTKPEKFRDPRDYAALKAALPIKADEFDATNIAGQGQEWVGTLYGTTLWEKARDETKVFSEMSRRGMFMQEIPQGHSSVVIPTEGADPIAYSTPEANDLDATNRPEVTANIGFFGTGNKTLSAAQIKIAAAATDELMEDSVIPILPQMTRQMQIKATETLDQAIINGDTETGASTNINLIDGTPATGISRPYYLAVNGLRKYPLVTNTAYARDASGAFSLDDFRLTLKLFNSAVRDRIEDLFFLLDSDTHNAALAIPEIATDDVRRTNATITSGRLLNVFGVDVVTTGFMGLANSAGKISGTPSNNTLGQLLAIYPAFWAFGWKRDVRLDTEYSALSGTTVAVASMRFGFIARGADASAETYNVGIS